ncbi:permease prefix domain 1-containing protein [Rathayibacter sp. KR2-224]|uniref:permease prefix domain 1-containing protein n=1 Tax=Rathayibacter sp. KR2-224 TaxID=3400913 RepID=UPI003C051C99
MSARDQGELDARLDEAFRRFPDTDELHDLKDELRASLAARVAELEASGSGPTAAVTAAFDELGDLAQLVAEVTGEPVSAADPAPPTDASRKPTDAASRASDAFELLRRHKVRPRPLFVVRTVVLAVVAAAGLALTVLAALGILGWPLAASVAVAVVLLAAPVGVIVGDGTHQETTTNYPLPGRRAVGYGAGAFLGLAGLALAGLFFGTMRDVWLLVVAAPLVVISIAWFSYLGATQTNRKKPWAARLRTEYAGYDGGDRFSKDPAAAARFGIYTVVIMVLSIAGFVVLSLTIGFLWSWLALVAGFVVFFLVLARMLFVPEHGSATAQRSTHNFTSDDKESRS